MRSDSDLPEERLAIDLYKEYRDTIRRPTFPPPPMEWAPLDELVERRERKTFRWWPVAALVAAALLIAVFLIPRGDQSSREVSELLAKSARVVLPEGRLISMRLGEQTLIRPAVMTEEVGSGPEMARVRSLFVAAHYSWREPLSARSFQDWRSRLREKRDSVSVIHQQGEKRGYRVRTETPANVLRSASLTLRATDLRPTNGTFTFEGEATLEMAEAPVPVAEEPAVIEEPPKETPAGPDDTLHVLAALNQIGADVGEPIEVSLDPRRRRVVVRAGGVSEERQRQIAQALRPLPRVALELDSPGAGEVPSRAPAPEPFTASMPGPLRKQLEDRLGGAAKLQETTDHVLEASAEALARTHALQVLAEKFPPEVEARLAANDVELLYTLRQRHVLELTRLVGRIRTELNPLLAASNDRPAPQPQPWQSGVSALAEAAQQADTLLNRLLAGSYPQAMGEEMLRRLRPEIERLEQAVEALK